MEEEKSTNPPYLVAKPWILKAFEKFGKTRLDKIKRETIRNFNITSPGNESKLINAIKFLGIINDDGEINQEKYKIFSYSEEKKKEELKKIIEESYKNLFNDVDIQKMNFDDLKDYFTHKYNFSGVQAERASLIFIFLCDLSGINLPTELQEKNKEVKIKERHSKNIPTTLKSKKREEIININQDLESGEIKDNIIRIIVRGKATTVFEAKTKKQLDKITKEELPSLLSFNKNYLPDDE
ncbi:MAG: DUF5343 domain-containing protein [Candidatus Nanoarchaeia archaeon]|nr:DUF5343 domain-containing protein [Candidatus Nanoarchaeia archaeon]MDD5357636.1 DUF5343 domain-containing protein [Candidatus Nanoarchaeia archaeon]MDD5588555.1 DUF5343 domain-containing protein [Candidatus Nanoarchaeia archaeon]